MPAFIELIRECCASLDDSDGDESDPIRTLKYTVEKFKLIEYVPFVVCGDESDAGQ